MAESSVSLADWACINPDREREVRAQLKAARADRQMAELFGEPVTERPAPVDPTSKPDRIMAYVDSVGGMASVGDIRSAVGDNATTTRALADLVAAGRLMIDKAKVGIGRPKTVYRLPG